MNDALPSRKHPEVLAAILTCRSGDMVRDSLDSLANSGCPNLRCLIVANGVAATVPGTFPNSVEILHSKRNLGCAGGRNLAMAHFLRSDADFFLSLDDDAELLPGALGKMIDCALSDEAIGIVGGLVKNTPTGKLWFDGGGVLDWARGTFTKPAFESAPFELDSVPGACFLARRAAVQAVPSLDERYWIYFEDTDWCVRVKKAGFRVVCLPEVVALHTPSSSYGMEAPAKYYYRARNRIRFFRIHAPQRLPGMLLHTIFEWITDLGPTLVLNRQWKQLRAAALGVLHGLIGIAGEYSQKG